MGEGVERKGSASGGVVHACSQQNSHATENTQSTKDMQYSFT
jgi:hypothetical protein